MALVDVLDFFPKDHPARPELLGLLKKVANGVVKYQDKKSGVWWQVLDQGGREGNYLEATASSMFVYSLAKAVNNGWLPRDEYLPAVRSGYAGLIHEFIKPDANGDGRISLTRCCKVAGLDKKRDGTFEYYTKREPIVDNDPKGTGPFVLAGIEMETLLDSNAPNASHEKP
jgi:unsaturated rhamnogalacturonyl hydrolase